MKEGWKSNTLGEISISMADGPFGSNLKKEHYTLDKEVRIIQLSNIGEDGWREDNTKYTTFDHLETIKRSEVKPGNLVIAKMMPAGRAILCPDKEKAYVLSSDAVKVVLKEELLKEFILYQINSPFFRKQVYENVNGSGRVRTSLTKLRDCILQIPPLFEQQRIVSRLDASFAKIDALSKQAEEALEHAKALFQAKLKELMEKKEGWEEKKLGDVCRFFSGFAFKSNKFKEEGMPIIRISDIQNNKIDDSRVVYFNPKDYPQDLNRYIIYPGEIIIAMSGGTTGKIGKNETNKQFYLNQRVGAFRENKEILNHDFLYYYLQTKSEESLRIAAGAAQPNLSTAQINNYIIPLPSLGEQDRIANTLDSLSQKIQQLQQNYNQTLANCQALKQAILKETFE